MITLIPYSVRRLTLLMSIAWGLTACQTVSQVPDAELVPPVVAQPLPEPVKPVDPLILKEQELVDAIQLYMNGKYDDAIKVMTPLARSEELPLSSQVKALKYIAFSHCVEGRRKSCRQHFEMALALDATFQLTEAEKNHPVWGREFRNARAALRNKRPALARKTH